MYNTWFAKHFDTDHTQFPLEKSWHFPQQGLSPGPLSNTGHFSCRMFKKPFIFSKKKKRLKYVLAFKPKAAQVVLNRITRKNYTLNKYQIWKDVPPIVYLELHSLEKHPENLSIKTQKKVSEKTICSFLWQEEWKCCDKHYKPTDAHGSLVRTGAACLFVFYWL